MRRRTSLILIVTPLLWTACWLYLSPPRPPLFENETLFAVGAGKLVETYGRPNLVSIEGGSTVEWELELTYPSHVYTNTSFLIEARPRISNITTWGSRVPDRDSIEKSAFQSLENGMVSVTLNMSGATVSPQTIKSFPIEGTSAWSVYVPSEGTHAAVITVDGPNDSEEGPALEFKGDTKVKVSARKPFFTASNFVSFVAVVLGPLVSIPGIFAFLRDVRNAKTVKKAHR